LNKTIGMLQLRLIKNQNVTTKAYIKIGMLQLTIK